MVRPGRSGMINAKEECGMSKIDWKEIDSEEGLNEALNQELAVIFKHSTTCVISGMVLNRLESSWNSGEMGKAKMYYVDLLGHRNISSQISDQLSVQHESPQMIILNKGEVKYHTSHMGISYKGLKVEVEKVLG